MPLKALLHPSEHESAAVLGDESHNHASIAILPFTVIGPGDSARYIALGLAEDLTHRLSRSLFPVIAPSSSFSQRGNDISAESVGEQLGAGYLVLGALQLDRAKARVTAHVVRARDKLVLCSRQYECAFDGLFAAQDDLAARIVDQVGTVILDAESALLLRRNPADMDAWELAPDTSIQGMARLVASTNRDIAQRYQAGLRLAGLSPA